MVDLCSMGSQEKSGSLTARQSRSLHQTVSYSRHAGAYSNAAKKQRKVNSKKKKKGNADAPVAESGASALLPRWISWAAKLFSLNEVPFTTGASSSNGFTEASEDTVMYCRANHRAVLPSWSLSSRSSLSRGREVSRVTGGLEQLPDSSKGGAQLTVCTVVAG